MTKLDSESPTHRGSFEPREQKWPPRLVFSEEKNVLIDDKAKVKDARNKPALICKMPWRAPGTR